MSELIDAIKRGRLADALRLIANGADVNLADKYGETPLIIAASNSNTEVVEALLTMRADVNLADINGCTPLLWAAKNGCTEVVEALIRAGAEVNQKSILAAVTGSHLEIIKLLLIAYPYVNRLGDSKVTSSQEKIFPRNIVYILELLNSPSPNIRQIKAVLAEAVEPRVMRSDDTQQLYEQLQREFLKIMPLSKRDCILVSEGAGQLRHQPLASQAFDICTPFLLINKNTRRALMYHVDCVSTLGSSLTRYKYQPEQAPDYIANPEVASYHDFMNEEGDKCGFRILGERTFRLDDIYNKFSEDGVEMKNIEFFDSDLRGNLKTWQLQYIPAEGKLFLRVDLKEKLVTEFDLSVGLPEPTELSLDEKNQIDLLYAQKKQYAYSMHYANRRFKTRLENALVKFNAEDITSLERSFEGMEVSLEDCCKYMLKDNVQILFESLKLIFEDLVDEELASSAESSSIDKLTGDLRNTCEKALNFYRFLHYQIKIWNDPELLQIIEREISQITTYFIHKEDYHKPNVLFAILTFLNKELIPCFLEPSRTMVISREGDEHDGEEEEDDEAKEEEPIVSSSASSQSFFPNPREDECEAVAIATLVQPSRRRGEEEEEEEHEGDQEYKGGR